MTRPFKPRDFLKSSVSFRIYYNIGDNIIDNILFNIRRTPLYISISQPKFGNMWFVWYLTYGVPHHYNESARNRFWFLDLTEHQMATVSDKLFSRNMKKGFWMNIERVGIMKLTMMVYNCRRLLRHVYVIRYYVIEAFRNSLEYVMANTLVYSEDVLTCQLTYTYLRR